MNLSEDLIGGNSLVITVVTMLPGNVASELELLTEEVVINPAEVEPEDDVR